VSASGYEKFQGTARFQSLDGLRALSVLGVIGHHVCARYLLTGFVTRGFLGVWVFFAISGFLITTLLLRERVRYGEISLRRFYAKRSLRIFPLYYTVLTAYVLMVFVVQRHQPAGQQFFQHLPYFATYTSNWFVPVGPHVIFYFAWSLATEEQFYTVWPWIEKFVPSGAVGVVLILIFLHLLPKAGLFSSISVPLCFGVLLAHALHRRQSFALLARLLYPRYMVVVWLGLFVFLVALWPALVPAPLQEVLMSIAIVLLVGSCVIREDHALAPFLRLKILASCGTVSYGMYLMHMLCINAAITLLQHIHLATPLLVFLLSSVVVYGVACVSFYQYESRFLALKKGEWVTSSGSFSAIPVTCRRRASSR
jgi:peptidoglycan/LPS O-acetylase OafA/YrhL